MRRALALAVALSLGAAAATGRSPAYELVVSTAAGDVVARFALTRDAAVALRYRNSLYGSLAEERFRVDGASLRLVEVAADERAVLDEYYVTEGATRADAGDARSWRARPREPLALETIAIAATDLGKRTLLVPDRRPLELWRFVRDHDPTVVIELRPRA